MESLPYLLDMAGTFVFALSGAMAGVKHKLDVFGVLVLAVASLTKRPTNLGKSEVRPAAD